MNTNSRIFIAGHRGMVGSALVRRLRSAGFNELILCGRDELDLRDQHAVHSFLEGAKPDYIFMAAAKVGGIQANDRYRADFLYENLAIQNNVIHGAHLAGVQRLMFLGSSCIYPRDAVQPIREDSLLTGPLEQTNEPYAIAKIAGLKMCESYNRQYGRQYVSVMPTNLYGPNDNYDLNTSHVLPALLRKAHEAALRGDAFLTVWGTGTPLREFLYVDDLADACVHLFSIAYDGPPVNIGTGTDVTIAEAAQMIAEVVGFQGRIAYDPTKPDGTPRKLLDVSRLAATGWRPRTSLRDGLRLAYEAAPFDPSPVRETARQQAS